MAQAQKAQLKDPTTGQKVYPVTSSACVGMKDGSGSLDDHLQKMKTEYNVSVFHPTSGTGGTNRYDLAGAITQVPSELRTDGLTISFLNSDGNTEKWEFGGGYWTVGSFSQIGAEKFTELEKSKVTSKIFQVGNTVTEGYYKISIPKSNTAKILDVKWMRWGRNANYGTDENSFIRFEMLIDSYDINSCPLKIYRDVESLYSPTLYYDSTDGSLYVKISKNQDEINLSNSILAVDLYSEYDSKQLSLELVSEIGEEVVELEDNVEFNSEADYSYIPIDKNYVKLTLPLENSQRNIIISLLASYYVNMNYSGDAKIFFLNKFTKAVCSISSDFIKSIKIEYNSDKTEAYLYIEFSITETYSTLFAFASQAKSINTYGINRNTIPVLEYVDSIPTSAEDVQIVLSSNNSGGVNGISGSIANSYQDRNNATESIKDNFEYKEYRISSSNFSPMSGIAINALSTWYKATKKTIISGIKINCTHENDNPFTSDIKIEAYTKDGTKYSSKIDFDTLKQCNSLIQQETPFHSDLNRIAYLDNNIVLEEGDIVKIEVKCTASTDKVRYIAVFPEKLFDKNLSKGFMNDSLDKFLQTQSVSGKWSEPVNSNYFHFIELVSDVSQVPERRYNIITPITIYTVYNDAKVIETQSSKGKEYSYNRQIAAKVYLDHFIAYLSEYTNLYFGNHLTSDIFISENSKEDYNKGVEIYSQIWNKKIMSENSETIPFTITQISSLASNGKDITPRVLVISDSLSATLAYDYSNNYKVDNNWVGLIPSLFAMDEIDSGESNKYQCFMLGTRETGSSVHKRTVSYLDKNIEITANQVGMPGGSLNQLINGSNWSSVWNSEENKFSIKYLVENYRTYTDDTLEKIPWGDERIGAKVDKSYYDADETRVCTPTHVILTLSTNDSDVDIYIENIKKFIEILSTEYPGENGGTSLYVALAVMDSGISYFPENNMTEDYIAWKNGVGFMNAYDNRHNKQWEFMKALQENYISENWADKNISILPFFFVAPPKTMGRMLYTPSSVFGLRTEYIYAPIDSTHIGFEAHAAWAYQAYSWIKSTLAPNLAPNLGSL